MSGGYLSRKGCLFYFRSSCTGIAMVLSGFLKFHGLWPSLVHGGTAWRATYSVQHTACSITHMHIGVCKPLQCIQVFIYRCIYTHTAFIGVYTFAIIVCMYTLCTYIAHCVQHIGSQVRGHRLALRSSNTLHRLALGLSQLLLLLLIIMIIIMLTIMIMIIIVLIVTL